MKVLELMAAKKSLLQTIGLTAAAFIVALPVGAAVMPHDTAAADSVTTTVTKTVADGLGSCTTGTSNSSTSKTTTTTTKTTPVVTTASHTTTTTQNSTNDHGATAQASDHSIAAAVNVGDVLSNNNVLSGNNVSVPVLSNNSTTVSPTVNVPVLGGTNSILGGVLGGLGL